MLGLASTEFFRYNYNLTLNDDQGTAQRQLPPFFSRLHPTVLLLQVDRIEHRTDTDHSRQELHGNAFHYPALR